MSSLVPSRPILELREDRSSTDRQTFFSFLDTTLQRYLDHNLPLQVLILDISHTKNSRLVSLLDKWVPVVVTNTRLNTFHLKFESNYFHLPPIRIPRGIKSRQLSADPIHLTRLPHFTFLDGLNGHLILEIDSPRISITGNDNWIHATNHSSFARLKSLSLSHVQLSENSFVTLSNPDCFGCLEDLTLSGCHGFEEFRLKSSSVKNLTLNLVKNFDIDVDVPNIVCFDLSFFIRQPSIFFTTTSSEWKSEIRFNVFSSQVYDTQMLRNLYQLHKAALSHSEFSLHIQDLSLFVRREEDEDDVSLYPPAVAIERLCMWMILHSPASAGAFLSHLFCFFHPRYIEHTCNVKKCDEYAECLVGILVHANIQGLEEVIIGTFEENGEECESSSNESRMICLQLKWGDS